ncbi:MAG: lactate racemase domain-containing protein [bacterium]
MAERFMIGFGSETDSLSDRRVRELCHEAFADRELDGKRLLLIVPDDTRSGPIDLMFRTLYDLLANRTATFDLLIALGTHPPMSPDAIYRRVGIRDEQEHRTRFPKAGFFNHHWNDPRHLRLAGTIPSEEVQKISHGLILEDIPVTVNKMVYDYDTLLIVGPVFPHEVVGFSGGNKYFFPGISGPEIINAFHWLGALICNVNIIGKKHTPVREVVDRAATFLSMEKICVALVVQGTQDLHGLFIGSPEEAWAAAADLSAKVNVVYLQRAYRQVLSVVPEMYHDLWTGAKGMYKLESVVEDGGELIIYGPHITEVSVTHGETLQRIGYHVRDYFVRQMDRFSAVPGGLLAHSTHVKGMGTFDNGVETPRIQVTLATGIPEGVCRRINLGYRNPNTIKISDWQNRQEEGILVVPRAGEKLYRLAEQGQVKNTGQGIS